MSLTIVFILLGIAGFGGVALGYLLRWALTFGKRGSAELEVKRMLLDAKEEAKRITSSAEEKVRETLELARTEFKNKEDDLKRTGERLIKKEELLDKRQLDIDSEVEHIKTKIAEVKEVRDKAEALFVKRQEELEKIAGVTPEEAKTELMRTFEKQFEQDLLVRMQKLEVTGQEKIEHKARELLTTVIHRLGNSVAADVVTNNYPPFRRD